jgi:hypothetical protein
MLTRVFTVAKQIQFFFFNYLLSPKGGPAFFIRWYYRQMGNLKALYKEFMKEDNIRTR